MWCTYIIDYYSTIKKNEVMPSAATWMNLEIIILIKVSQRKTNTMWYHLYVESKIWHKWTYPQNRNTLTDIQNRLVVVKGEREMREFRISRCEPLYTEWLNNELLLYSTGNYIQYPMINHNGKEYFKNVSIYICVTGSHCCVAKFSTTL